MKRVYLLLVVVFSTTLSFAQAAKTRMNFSPLKTEGVSTHFTSSSFRMEGAASMNKVELSKIQFQGMQKSLTNTDFVAAPLRNIKNVNFFQKKQNLPAADLSVFYPAPDGALYIGWNNEFKTFLDLQLLKIPAFVPIPFVPYASEQGVEFNWTYQNESLDDYTDDYGVLNFSASIMQYPRYINMPVLHGKKGTQTASYEFGSNYEHRGFFAGDANLDPLTLVNINNDPTNVNTYIGFQNGNNFGPSYSYNGVPCTGVLITMPQIQSPLYVESVDAIIYAPNGIENVMPANGKLELEISYAIDKGNGNYEYETIATATATRDDLLSYPSAQDAGRAYFHFVAQEVIDGLVTDVPIVIGTKAPLIVSITGFDSSWDFRFYMGVNPWLGSAYTVHGNQVSTFGYEDAPEYPRCDLHVNFNGLFNCLYPAEVSQKVTIPDAGGYGYYVLPDDDQTYNDVAVFSSFDIDNIWLENEMPEWINIEVDNSYFAGSDQISNLLLFFFSAEALPAGMKGRSAEIVLASYGITASLQVKQGDAPWVGVPSIGVNEVFKAVREGDNFVLSYPASSTSVAVYSASGQKVGEYKLNADGTATIPASNWAKGIYLFKFNGSNRAVKVLK
jgi:hypothetical protein